MKETLPQRNIYKEICSKGNMQKTIQFSTPNWLELIKIFKNSKKKHRQIDITSNKNILGMRFIINSWKKPETRKLWLNNQSNYNVS